MNQRELADKAGLSKFTVNRLEHGHHKPELDTIVALATALGIAMDELLVSNGDAT